MPVHSLATVFGNISSSQLIVGAITFALIIFVKAWAGGRKCTWERDWKGKMILVVASPTTTIITLIDTLLHLPSPPQILFLPDTKSPLPESLLTLLHTIKLSSISKNPSAQLHCESLPLTPESIRNFVIKWNSSPVQMVGEGGRRVDCIIFGKGWEVDKSNFLSNLTKNEKEEEIINWDNNQFKFHFLNSFLPLLLKSPLERDIRIIQLISPTWSSALPALASSLNNLTKEEGEKTKKIRKLDLINGTGKKNLESLLCFKHFQIILDTLEAIQRGKVKPIPNPEKPEENLKVRDTNVKSNIKSISVIMPWARDEVLKGSLVSSPLSKLSWILFYPLILILTPSSKSTVQSILFALSAPVREGTIDDTPKVAEQGKEIYEQRRNGVAGGDVIRDCGVVDLPPVLSDPVLAKAVYEELEKQVEKGVKESQTKSKLQKAQ
ncbi:uncharacterized protein I206_101190 [Kwoniella pini CBS 10737]|uniref:Uncharacterized protein n=1 Tax=Kwoniella pini CBS 10737 TaxID=1296096 RepID=A0A1B9IBS0_9TREE|nr:uncharacterized protein I206_00133 [Kwoniella pini CBS 10737]OCF52837.1 hypothetical protein I206_00133 [Kwoniella pini CBS 10737]